MSEQANQTIEKIGGVTLDFSRYPGQDYYCDGEVEEELLALVREHAPREFPALIEQRGDWESLYHLSPERGNIVRWLPFTGSEKVLEIGAGPGAVTSALCGRVRRVDCVELSARRSRINAYRNRERDNITIHVGNFADIEPALPADYDYILLIGVFEYARAYLGSGDAFHEELRRLLPHLAPGGRAVIAIENRLGLKYFAGCREDHTGRYFDGVEDYPDPETAVHTFSRPALERIFADCGVEQASFYYPYPDYKFPSVLFSDRRLPQASELTENIRNFDRDRLLLFDEQKAYHGIVDDGLYPVFSNSYAVVIGEPLPVSYCKFSGDRAPQYRIQTELRTGENGERQIVKRPLTPEAAAHVERLVTSCEKLKRRYEGGALAIAPCRREEVSGRRAGTVVPGLPENGAPGTEAAHGALSGVVFPFIKGRPLEELLDERLTRGDLEGFRALLRTFYERAGYRDGEPVADYDMTFANILVDGDLWTAIDYEWTIEEALPAQELLFRALYCYILEKEERQSLDLEALLSEYGITPEQIEAYRQKEPQFQQMVTGGAAALGALRAQIGGDVIVPGELIVEDPVLMAREEEKRRDEEAQERSLASVQVYFDEGTGYSEETSFFVPERYGEEGVIRFTIPVPPSVRRLRIDPALCPCIALLRGVECAEEPCGAFRELVRANGTALGAAGGLFGKLSGHSAETGTECTGFLFTTHDPYMEWDMEKVRRRRRAGKKTESGAQTGYTFTIQMAGLPATMAQALEKSRE